MSINILALHFDFKLFFRNMLAQRFGSRRIKKGHILFEFIFILGRHINTCGGEGGRRKNIRPIITESTLCLFFVNRNIKSRFGNESGGGNSAVTQSGYDYLFSQIKPSL